MRRAIYVLSRVDGSLCHLGLEFLGCLVLEVTPAVSGRKHGIDECRRRDSLDTGECLGLVVCLNRVQLQARVGALVQREWNWVIGQKKDNFAHRFL
jgi:hypothetical protein